MAAFCRPEVRARMIGCSSDLKTMQGDPPATDGVQVPACSARARVDKSAARTLADEMIDREIAALMRGRTFGDELRTLRSAVPTTSYEGRIYFLRSVDGYIKVGFTKHVGRRLSGHRTSAPDVEFLCDIPGSRNLERRLHNYFSEHRYQGEWFRPCDELLAVVKSPAEFFGLEREKERRAADLPRKKSSISDPQETAAARAEIEQLRGALGLSQRAMARALGVARTSYQAWMSHNCPGARPSGVVLESARRLVRAEACEPARAVGAA
jgi:DNA-binding transcriptional regulator YiaG